MLELRFDAEAVVTYMFAAADGGALQRLTDPEPRLLRRRSSAAAGRRPAS